MNLQEMFESYQNYVLATKTKATWLYNSYHIPIMLKWFENNQVENITELDLNKLYSFIGYFRTRSKNITVNKKLLILKQIIKYHSISGCDHILRFKKLKETVTHFDILTEEELKKIMNYIYRLDDGNIHQLTKKVLLLLLLDSCARRNEILNIEVKNIRFETKEIILTNTKTKIDRYIYFSKLTDASLKKYVAFDPERKYLFFNYRCNTRFSIRHVRFILDNMKDKLGIQKLHAHMFRHTMATLLIERDVDVYILKEILGHKDIKTTEIYIHMNRKKIKSEHQRASYLSDK